MGSFSKAHGIDVTVHDQAPDTGCGNPCHPEHRCSACEPFWNNMQATGRFAALEPTTFAGDAAIHKTNLGARKIDYSQPSLRTKVGGR